MFIYLVLDFAVRHIVTRVDLPDVLYYAQKVICTRSTQLRIILGIGAPTTRCVGEHVQLQRELYFRVDLRRDPIATPLLKFKSLGQTVSTCRSGG